jgi:putative phage-type endonuclease
MVNTLIEQINQRIASQGSSKTPRQEYLGASEIAAALGLSKYRTPHDVWLLKTGRATPLPPNNNMMRGISLEPLVINMLKEQDGFNIAETQAEYSHPDHPFIKGHVDGLLPDKDAVLEIKCPRSIAYYQLQTKGVSTDYKVQAQVYAGLTGMSRVVLVNFCADVWDKFIIEMDFDKDVYEAIIEQAAEWWHNYVVKDVPPPAVSIDDSEAGSSEPVADDEAGRVEVIQREDREWLSWAARMREVEEIYKEVSALRESLLQEGFEGLAGKAPGKYEGGGVRLSIWPTPARETFNFKAFRQANPDIDFSPYLKLGKPGVSKRLTLLGEK